MKHITHWRFADEYPENTLSAARQAATQADMIELDPRRCRSGEIVVMHDSIVDAVTDARERAKALSATALNRLNVSEVSQVDFSCTSEEETTLANKISKCV